MIRVCFHAVAGPQGGPRTYAVALAHALQARDDLKLIVLTDRPDAFPGMRCVELPTLKPWSDRVWTSGSRPNAWSAGHRDGFPMAV